jgi:ketosteroid isomerase-like protein
MFPVWARMLNKFCSRVKRFRAIENTRRVPRTGRGDAPPVRIAVVANHLSSLYGCLMAGFARSIVLPVLISGVILFAPANARSGSAPKGLGGKQADHTSAVSKIRSVLRMQQDAWNHDDIDRFMDGYAHSKDTVFISEDTVRRGWETVRHRYREKYSDRTKMGLLTFSDLEVVSLSPNAAVALGRWKLQRAKDRPHGRFTLIFRRLPEGWRIVHDHTSAAKQL